MSNKRSNFPNAQQPDVQPGEMAAIIERMTELQKLPRVTEANGVRTRIEYMFQRCIEEDVKPGVEMMALSLGVTRQTLLDWQKEGSRTWRNYHTCKTSYSGTFGELGDKWEN